MTKPLGTNPLSDNLGLVISDDGILATPTEWKDGQWAYYTDLGFLAVAQQG